MRPWARPSLLRVNRLVVRCRCSSVLLVDDSESHEHRRPGFPAHLNTSVDRTVEAVQGRAAHMANACPMLAMGSETSRGNDPGTRPQETASAGQETTQRCDARPSALPDGAPAPFGAACIWRRAGCRN